ncbi:DUF732 domain-containing protein [Mycobacterium sp. 94-17]|uniref:DUF732 domain-containing protein n=1 Tax=Mycobacterium sp. 94-17 TaxID=2986147 RepID=UPI002D1E7518|nr:DUF732 domain-containing protein [Mycobacterium sp. 94-17]MEB4212320.1 DUF732 domain-containing protein [Mycobacterium sp. 94-17]
MTRDVRKLFGSSFTVLAVALGISALQAPTGHADDNQYLADLHAPGMVHPAIPDSGLIAVGNDVCAKLHGGATHDAARDWLVAHLGHAGYQASNAEAGTVVTYAQQDLCP